VVAVIALAAALAGAVMITRANRDTETPGAVSAAADEARAASV
jgi:hypothetical protein